MKKGIATFDAEIKTLRQIISRKHVIPDMQRPYEWSVETRGKHVKILWDSFLEFHLDDIKHEDVYYTGTMICYPDGKNYSVIDGQQRLTSISVLFFAIRDLIDESTLNSEAVIRVTGLVPEVKIGKLAKHISKIALGTPKNPHLKPKEGTRNTLAYQWLLHPLGERPLATHGVGNPRANFKINQAYRFFKRELIKEFYLEEVSDFQQMMIFADHLLDGVVFNLTTVKDMAQGYRIFSSENTTGLNLNHLDITRALIMAQIDRKKLVNAETSVRNSLTKMSKNMESHSTAEKTKFIKIFWGIQEGKPLSKTKLMNKMNDQIKKCKNDEKIKFLSSKLSKWSKIYSTQILNRSADLPHFRIHTDLTKCRFRQHQPLLLALLMRKSKPDKEELNDILSIVETIYVRNNIILNQRASVVEASFWKWARRANDQSISIDKLKKRMLRDIKDLSLEVSRDQFTSIFSGIHPDVNQATFLLSKIERFKTSKLDEISDFENISALPIFPIVNIFDSLHEDWKKLTNVNSYLNEQPQKRIGNYILTKKKTFSQEYNLRNMRYKEKMPFLRRNTKKFKFTNDRFAQDNFQYDFRPQDIINLGDELAEIAVELWNFNNFE